jgi:UDP-N-acetylmuramate: L-alanyl-gamma-D-glutamyl-meso-diaminopimelate ligase
MNVMRINERGINSIYLIGIGGAAMAPLAGMLAERGYQVSGSDTGVYPPASTLLEKLGIRWQNGFRESNLAPQPDLVVIGNAISRGNPELEFVLDHKIAYRSLPETIKEFFLPGHDSLVVTGTHGKTTTTSMLAWIFHVAGRRPDFLIGGFAENFGKSYGLGGGKEFIIEGDEYDSAFFDKGPKFLHYQPDDLIVTSLEFDHADIYADLAAIELQFRRLVNLVPRRGRIVCWGESATVRGVVAQAFCPVETYGLGAENLWIAGDLEFRDGATQFRVVRKTEERARVSLPLVGRHNVLNALATVAIADGRGIPREAIEEALRSFRGVARRMQVRGEVAGVTIVDDFAHHPTAIRATIEGARTRWPRRRLWVAFEPRSNTMRRRIFEDDLAGALATADGVVLGPVNRAQLLPEAERLSPERVVKAVRAAGRRAEAFGSAAEIAEFLASELRDGDMMLVLSNGSFDGLCDKLLSLLSSRSPASRGVR